MLLRCLSLFSLGMAGLMVVMILPANVRASTAASAGGRLAASKKMANAAEGQDGSGSELYWDNGINVGSPKSNIRVKIGGRLQVDGGNIAADRGLQGAFPGLAGANAQVRRLWVTSRASFHDRVEFKLSMDFVDVPTLQDAYLDINKIPALGHIFVGRAKEPFSLEELIGNVSTTFMERALPTSVFAPARNVGFGIHNTAFRNRVTWTAGGFWNTGAISTRTGFDGKGFDLTGRVTGLPWYRDGGRQLLHLGLAFSHRFATVPSISLGTLPESHLTNEKLVNTGDFPVDEASLIDSELALVWGPFSLQAEIFQEFTKAATNHWFWGYYGYISYLLTGENRLYDLSSAIFSPLQPRHDFNPMRGQWGAWELALRYSAVDLSDNGVEGGKEHNLTAGLNWYLNGNTRLMFNYIHLEVEKPLSSDADKERGDIVQTRFQVFF